MMRTTKTNKKVARRIRRAKRIINRTLIIAVFVCALIGLWKATYYWPDQKVKDTQKISELQAVDSEDYKEIKSLFAEEIESRTGKKVEKVVFYISAFDSYWDYSATVYYEADGKWFTYTADEFSRRIDTQLENKLLGILIG